MRENHTRGKAESFGANFMLGYRQNIQFGWNINAAEFIIFIP